MMVNTSFLRSSHGVFNHCFSATAVTNGLCISVDETIPNWFRSLMTTQDPQCISIASANYMWNFVGLFGLVQLVAFSMNVHSFESVVEMMLSMLKDVGSSLSNCCDVSLWRRSLCALLHWELVAHWEHTESDYSEDSDTSWWRWKLYGSTLCYPALELNDWTGVCTHLKATKADKCFLKYNVPVSLTNDKNPPFTSLSLCC